MMRYTVRPWPSQRYAVIDAQTGAPVDIKLHSCEAHACANRLNREHA